MKKIHEKSPCCGGEIRRFGGRRRQCKQCKKTWTVWKKKTGRKEKRVSKQLAINFLNNLSLSAYAQGKYRNKQARTLNRQLEKSRNLFCRTTAYPPLPQKENLILIADAKIKLIDKQWYTLFVMLVRSTEKDKATILPAILLKGKETQSAWQKVLDSLDISIKTRIKAIVCDGHVGLINYAKRKRWIIQRCHFHLLSAIQGRRSRWSKSNHQQEGILVHNLVEDILTNSDEDQLQKSLSLLENLALNTTSKQLKRILLGFINSYEYFRNYLYHPEFNLPNTSNTAESLNSCIQNMFQKSRGFRTPQSLEKWTEALIKNKRFVMCKPAKNQQSFCL